MAKKLLNAFPGIRDRVSQIRVKRANSKNLSRQPKKTYAQLGEDLLIDHALAHLGRKQPSYLDLGAYHPTSLSNTFLFYERGCRGVCVEPDPARCAYIAQIRPNDRCLNIGVGFGESKQSDFYVMTSADLCTFSKEEAERLLNFGQKIEQIVSISLKNINLILADNFTEPGPDLISLDIEGLDLAVLQDLDFSKYRPAVFCIETLNPKTQSTKESDIIDLMKSRNYSVFADTFINTIFIDSKLK